MIKISPEEIAHSTWRQRVAAILDSPHAFVATVVCIGIYLGTGMSVFLALYAMPVSNGFTHPANLHQVSLRNLRSQLMSKIVLAVTLRRPSGSLLL